MSASNQNETTAYVLSHNTNTLITGTIRVFVSKDVLPLDLESVPEGKVDGVIRPIAEGSIAKNFGAFGRRAFFEHIYKVQTARRGTHFDVTYRLSLGGSVEL